MASQLKRRIDLDDANHVLSLREEIAKRVNSELIREISKAIIPALDSLRDAVSERDFERATKAGGGGRVEPLYSGGPYY